MRLLKELLIQLSHSQILQGEKEFEYLITKTDEQLWKKYNKLKEKDKISINNFTQLD
jgi:hypothetical protein